MIVNSWKNTTLICGFCNKEMSLTAGRTIDYRCPDCNNSVSSVRFEKILDKISKLEDEKFFQKEMGPLTGENFRIGNSLLCKILDDNQKGHFTVSVKNLERRM